MIEGQRVFGRRIFTASRLLIPMLRHHTYSDAAFEDICSRVDQP